MGELCQLFLHLCVVQLTFLISLLTNQRTFVEARTLNWKFALTFVSSLPGVLMVDVSTYQVCNHPELFERNEGQSSVHFAAIPHPLPPPPFGELEDVYYAGASNPLSYKVFACCFIASFRQAFVRDSLEWGCVSTFRVKIETCFSCSFLPCRFRSCYLEMACAAYPVRALDRLKALSRNGLSLN